MADLRDEWEKAAPAADLATEWERAAPVVSLRDEWERAKPAAPTMTTQSALDVPLAEQPVMGPINTAVEWLAGEGVRQATGSRMLTGAEMARQQQQVERTGGAEIDETNDSASATALKFGSNTLAGAVGVVGSPFVLAAQVGASAGREIAEGLARLTLPLWLDEETHRRIKNTLEEGELSWQAHGDRLSDRTIEGLKAAVGGISPAATAAVIAEHRGEDPLEAAAVSFFNEPVENLLGPLFIAKGAAKAGGKSRVVDVPLESGKVAQVTPKNVRAEPLKLNEVGWKLWDRTPDHLKPYLWDTEAPRTQAVAESVESAKGAARKVRSDAAGDMLRFYVENDGDPRIKSMLDDVQREAAARGTPLTQLDLKRVVEGKYYDDADGLPEGAAKVGVQKQTTGVNLTDSDGHARGVMFKSLIDNGLTPEDARVVSAYVDVLTPHLLDDVAPAALAQGIALPSGSAKTAADVYNHVFKSLDALPDAQRPTAARALADFSRRLQNDPKWIAFAETPYESRGGYLFKKRARHSDAEVRQQFNEAYGKVLEAEVEAARAGGYQAQLSLPVSELGELHATKPFKLWSQYAQNTALSPEGRARLLYAMRADPVSRFVADPQAPPVAKYIAAKLSEPGGVYQDFRARMRQLNSEIAAHQGIDPAVMAKHFDEYLSHSLRQASEMQSEIAEMFDQAFLAGVPDTKAPRFKRKLSADEHAQWYSDMEAQGKISPEQMLRFTAHQTARLAQRMTEFAEKESTLRKAGLLADTPLRPDWVQVATDRVAQKRDAASGDPYNFIFGKMAGKHVAPEVAQKMALSRHEYGRASRVMGLWKLLHTPFNLFGYQQTNHMGDLVMMSSATGMSPYSPKFRRQQFGALRAVERFDDAFGTEKPGKKLADRDLIEAIEFDIIRPGKIAVLHEGNDTPLGKAATSYVDVMSQVAERPLDPVDGSWQLARLQAYMAGTKGFVQGFKGAPRSFVDKLSRSVREAFLAYAEARSDVRPGAAGVPKQKDLKPQVGVTKAMLLGGEKLLDGFYRELQDTAIVRWTARQENVRRLTLYKIGKHEMGLSPQDAARLVDKTLNYGGDWPHWLQKARSSMAGQYLLPPFLSYGVHQAKFGLVRAFNEPRLWGMSVLVDAMQGFDAEAMPEDDHLAMLRLNAVTSMGAGRLYLGTNGDMADALQDIGFGKEFTDAVRGGNLAHTLSLRGWASLNHALSRLEPGRDTLTTLARLGPTYDFLFTAADPDAYSEALGPGANPFAKQAWAEAKARVWKLMQLMVPTYGMYQIGQSADAAVGLTTGTVDTSGKSGQVIGKAEIMRAFSPSLNISPIDKDHLMVRLQARLRGAVSDLGERKRKYLSRENPTDPEGMLAISEAEVGLAFAVAREKLSYVRKVMGRQAVPESAFEDLDKAEAAALAEVKSAPVNVSLQNSSAGAILGALDAAVDETWAEAEELAGEGADE